MNELPDHWDHNGYYAEARAAIDAVHDGSTETGAGETGAGEILGSICRAAASYLELSGAAIQLMTRGQSLGVVASSDPRAEQLADLEFVIGGGPGLEAFALRRPVLVSDLEYDAGERWLGYDGNLTRAGVAAVFAFPLSLGAASFGVLELYADRPGPLSQHQLALALAFAQIGFEALLDAHPGSDEGLDRTYVMALDYRAEIAQAQGMVMVDLDVTLAEALVVLRGHAFAHDLRLIDLARAVIAGLSLASEPDA